MSVRSAFRIGWLRCSNRAVLVHRLALSGGSTPRFFTGGSRSSAHSKFRPIHERLAKKTTGTTPVTSKGRPRTRNDQRLPRAKEPELDLAPGRRFVEKLQAVGFRFPIACFLWFLVVSEETTPYKVSAVEGASMLPTFAAQGDLVMNETGAWFRLFGRDIPYQIGDIIVWKNPNNSGQAMSVKRIIGLEGDEIRRFGEHVYLYVDDPNWGIADDPSCQDYDPDGTMSMSRTVVVPKGHVWVEGDNPPFSKDSRHYGPLPKEWLRGRIISRIWPIGGPRLTRERPVPVSMEELVANPQFNVHSIVSTQQTTE